MRRFLFPLALVFCAVPVGAAPLPGAKTGLAQVPASAPLVLQVRGLEGTVDRFVAFLKKALPDQAGLVGQFLKNFAEGTGGRDFVGLVKDGPHLLALLEMPKDGEVGLPAVAIFLATTDNKKFLEGFLKEAEKKELKKEEGGFRSTTQAETGELLYILEREGQVILTPRKEVATKLLAKNVGLDTRISAELADKFLTQDVGVFLNMDTILKDHPDQFKEFKKGFLDGVRMGAAGSGAGKGQVDLIVKGFEAFVQSLEDSKGCVAGLEIRPTAFVLHVQNEYRADSPTAKVLGRLKVGKFEELGKMPAGQLMYYGSELTAEMLGLIKELTATAEDDKRSRAIVAMLDAVLKARPGVANQFTGLPMLDLSLRTAADPKGLLASQVKMLEAAEAGDPIDLFGSMYLKAKPVIKTDAKKYRDISFTLIKLKPDLDKMAEGVGPELPEDFRKSAAEWFKKQVGEDLEFYLGVDDKQLIQVLARDWATAEKALDGYFAGKDSIRLLDGYAQIRKDLPSEASFLGLVDLPEYVAAILDLVKPLIEMQVELPPRYPAPAPKGAGGYLGLAIALTKERGTVDFVVSAESVLVTYKRFIAPFFGVK